MSTLVVNEVYGPVWQGEGPSAGRVCSFIRLMGCNLDCSWVTATGERSPCDEAQTWDASRFDLHAQGVRMEAAQIAAAALSCEAPMVVITGGEPLLHQTQDGWVELLRLLKKAGGVRVEVETNGTQIPTPVTREVVTQFNVSPKLPSSGVHHSRAIVPPVMRALAAPSLRAVFKFVCASVSDLDDVQAVAGEFGIQHHRIWIMPAGDTPDQVLAGARELAAEVTSLRYNLTLRQHTLIYGQAGEPR